MPTLLPLEDSAGDILGKAMRGLGLDAAALAALAGLPHARVAAALADPASAPDLPAIATALGLDPGALGAIARGGWRPQPREVEGLAVFTTPWRGMAVNAALAWDRAGGNAIAFDTGADAAPLLAFARARGLAIRLVLLTHAHPDHVADLPRLLAETGATAHANALEPVPGAAPFATGATFAAGALRVATRLTRGHSPGGTTYVVEGLGAPVAIVGDAVFAGSMGGPKVSYADALATARSGILSLPPETVLVPGHGPLTTVAEERLHNPFLASRA